jgi:hypothetical protein
MVRKITMMAEELKSPTSFFLPARGGGEASMNHFFVISEM